MDELGKIDEAAWGRISETLEVADGWGQLERDEWRQLVNGKLMRVLHRSSEQTVLIEVVTWAGMNVISVNFEDLARVAEDEIYVYFHIIELMQKTPA